MHHIPHIFHLVKQKYEYALAKDPTRATHVPYVKALEYCITNLDEHVIANNSLKLEDELGDILRDFFNLIHTLEKEGYIESQAGVFEACLGKYEERYTGHKDNVIDREETKSLQKSRLFHKQVLKNSQR